MQKIPKQEDAAEFREQAGEGWEERERGRPG
jgi:hypothetical protein